VAVDCADEPGVRLTLSYKFVLGSTCLAAAAIGFPGALHAAGVEVAPWVSVFAALGVGGLMGFFLSRELTHNFQVLRSATDRISRGDLTASVDVREDAPFPDETHDLARSVRGMLERLRDLVGHVQRTADLDSAAAQDLVRSAQALSARNEGISTTVAGVADSVAQEQKLLSETSRLVKDIAEAIDLNASRAREAFGFAAEANQKANTGVNVSRLALEKMKAVFERVEKASLKVFELEERTAHVHQIVEIITSVAQRTNLLSLNASIEAARAGEAGRGFSVVADEIRKLAESAGRSGDEISKLIRDIQSETGSVADEMRQSSQVINEGREDVNTIASSLEQIRAAVGEASDRAEEIFHQADSQTRDTERMVSSMEELSRVAAGNARAVDVVAASTREQLAAMAELVASTRRLTELADELRGVLRQFRTERGADAEGRP
jgi:methyl-accepting chemotaxis protein